MSEQEHDLSENLVNTFYNKVSSKILEVVVAQTFAKAKIKADEIDASDMKEEEKTSEKKRLFKMASFTLCFQKDMENIKNGLQISDMSKTMIQTEMGKYLQKGYSIEKMVFILNRQLVDARKIINEK